MAELTDEEIHTVLSNGRRKLTLEFLRGNGGSMTVRDLSERIAEAESGESPPPRNIRQSAYVSLHQTHLPKLHDSGVVDYDNQSKDVSLLEAADEVIRYLNVGDQPAVPGHEVYVGGGLLGTAVVLGAEYGVPGLASIPPTVWASLVFAAIATMGTYQTVRRRRGDRAGGGSSDR